MVFCHFERSAAKREILKRHMDCDERDFSLPLEMTAHGQPSSTIAPLGPWLLVLICLWVGPFCHEASAAEPKTSVVRDTESGPAEIVFQGKFFCSLVRQVIMYFPGTIRELKVSCGQAVCEGDILARYQLAKEAIGQVRRRVSPPQISELEMRLADVQRSMSTVGSKRREIRQLAAENMAPAQGLALVEQELQLLGKQRAAIQERLEQERKLAADDLALLKEQLAVRVESNQVPAAAVLAAPISGQVIWVQPELRNGAELAAGTPGFAIGVMDPMIMKAHVHEIEAMRLSVGDRAEISLESMPDRKAEGTITRLSWAPRTLGLDQPTFYEVELTVPNPGLSIRDGLKGQVVIRNKREQE
jgi:hypothetical protein